MLASSRTTTRSTVLLAALVAALSLVGDAAGAAAGRDHAPPPGAMLLSQSQKNGRYFQDRAGKIVYLQGSYIGLEFQDYIFGSPNPSDWNIAVSVLKANDANFLRLWTAESTGSPGSSSVLTTPMPYQRSNVCCAADGGNKFDLAKLDVGDLGHPSIDSPHYFERMRARVLDARSKGIYVSIMLFHSFRWEDGIRAPGSRSWDSHAFHAGNNVNGVDADANGDGHGLELGSTGNPWQSYQNAYIRQVVDSVGDLDNVLYEVCNECWDTPVTNDWQNSVVDLIHQYERDAGFARHPVGITSLQDFDNSVLLTGNADFIAPGGHGLEADPPVAAGSKVSVLDMDHVNPCSNRNSDDWPWESFMRGNNLWYIYCGPTGDGISYGDPSATEQVVMSRMGSVSALARDVDLARLQPDASPQTCSTTFCLRGPDEDLAYLPGGGSATIAPVEPGRYRVDWLDAQSGARTLGSSVLVQHRGDAVSVTSPFGDHDAVVRLHRGNR